MITLTDLQTLVAFFARDNSIVINTSPGLDVAQMMLRGLASVLHWDEFVVNRDQWITTQAGVPNYPLPEEPYYIEVLACRIQDKDDGMKYKPIYPFRDEQEWDSLLDMPADLPVQRRIIGGESLHDQQLWLAPAPKYGGLFVRMRGLVEPPQLLPPTGTGDGRTPFRSQYKDDIYALLLAAKFNMNRNATAYGTMNMQEAVNRVKQLGQWTPQVDEQLKGLAGFQPSGA